jgi:hypothetical protein
MGKVGSVFMACAISPQGGSVMDLEVKKRKEKYEEKFDRPFGFI